jgi:PAS domain-containing protein
MAPLAVPVSILAAAAFAAALYGVFHFRRRAMAAETALARRNEEAAMHGAIATARRENYVCWRLADGAETVSPGLEEMIGLAPGADGADEAPGEAPDGGWLATLAARLNAADANTLRAGVAALRDTGAEFHAAVSIPDSERSLEITGTRATRPDGTAVADLLLIHDRTIDAGEIGRLAATAEELRRLVELLPLPVWLRGGDLRLSYVNRAYRHAVEADSDTPPEALQEIAGGPRRGGGPTLAEDARAAGVLRSERDHVVMGGARRLVELCEVPISDADAADSFAAIAGYALDHTAIEEAEAELVRHVAGHEEVLQSLGTAIAIFGRDQTLQFFNNS